MWADRSPRDCDRRSGAAGNYFRKTAYDGPGEGGRVTGRRSRNLVGRARIDTLGNFWGIDYAPSDWKIEECASPATEQRLDQESMTAAKAGHLGRWRLTDVSAAACYLETAAPFPAGSPMLLSVRASETECLLEGTVRVSHPETGMGVERTGAPVHERRARVDELIGRLKSNREVPKIFVGRKEEGKQDRRDEGRDERKDDRHAAKNPPADAARNDELPRPAPATNYARGRR